MAIVSNFKAVSSQQFLFNAQNLDLEFGTNGRRTSPRAVLQISGLGGYREGLGAINVRVNLNGEHLSTVILRRWQEHLTLVPDVAVIDFDEARLRNTFIFWGYNTLSIRPTYVDSSDYCLLGPVVISYHRNSLTAW